MEYLRLCKGVRDKGKLYTRDEIANLELDGNSDYYLSVYFYNETQYKQFQETGSIKGIKDVLTNTLVFDFDNAEDPDQARSEAQKLIYKLTELGVKEKDIEIYFSGNKGFNLVLTLDRSITPTQTQELAEQIGKGINYDTTLYDASQILRVPATKHPKSGLYKIPLTFTQLFNLKLEEIKQLATNPANIIETFDWGMVTLPEKLYVTQTDTRDTKVKKDQRSEIYNITESSLGINFTNKSSQWKNCKWAILQGNFGHEQGERHHALTILAATCRGLGYDRETTYYMCKGALKKSAARTGRDEFSKEELWDNIINQSIFSDGWEGGQYSCKSDPWLKKYCDNLGEHKCKDKEEEVTSVDLTSMHKQFVNYATNFEQNIIKVGIAELDDNATLLASTLVGLLGQPGGGKTSFAINYLLNTSLRNVPSMFFSLDMGLPIVYAKLIQKESGLDFKTVMRMFKDDPKLAQSYVDKLNKQYKNVSFNFKSGLTVQDIKRSILEEQERKGNNIKLVVVDYLECIAGPYSDATANTGFIANQLKDLANELNICVLLLLQTQKHSTPDISDPLLSLKGVKGSSLIEQSCSTILTLWRDGYNPNYTKDDKYISFAVVKNRFGSLWKGDFSWTGMTGDIRSLTEEEHDELENFRQRKIMEKVLEAKRLADMEDKAGWGN